MISNLMRDVGAVGLGAWTPAGDSAETLGNRSFHAGILAPTAVAVAAVIKVWGSNDNRFPVLVATITLAGAAGTATDAFSDNFPWDSYRAEIVSMSPAGATVSVVGRV